MGHPLLVLKLVPSCTTPTAHGTLALLVQFAAGPFFKERISLPGSRQLEGSDLLELEISSDLHLYSNIRDVDGRAYAVAAPSAEANSE